MSVSKVSGSGRVGGPEAETQRDDPNAAPRPKPADAPLAVQPNVVSRHEPELRFKTHGAPAVRAIPAAASNGLGAPKPDVPPLRGDQVPGAADVLALLTPGERAGRLARLSVEAHATKGTQPARHEAARAALSRLLESTDRLSLEQTLRAAATQGTLGFIVEQTGLEDVLALGVARALNVNDVLAQSDTVRERGLTSSEARTVERLFAGSLDPSTVRLRFSPGVQTLGAAAMVLGNTIQLDPTSPRWQFRPGTTLPIDEENPEYREVLLAHEVTHVWSYQHRGSHYALESVRDQLGAMQQGAQRTSIYRYTPGEPSYFHYNEEQRAMIVQDFVACERAIARGEKTVFLSGAVRYANPAQFQKTLQPYIDELRNAGPGQPEPLVTPEPIVCACPAHGFRQDGMAGVLGAQADALIAQAGRASMEALQDGSAQEQFLGAVGVAGAVAASLAPREQNAHEGAHGGGTALLDQAGIPRGVTVQRGPVEMTAKLGYDAGFERPRAELGARAEGRIADADVRARAGAQVGLDGLQQAEGELSVRGDDVRAQAAAAWSRDSGDETERIHGRVGIEAGRLSGSARADVQTDAEGIRDGVVEARVDAPPGSVHGRAELGRHAVIESADLGATARVQGVNVGADVGLTKEGLERVSVSAGTKVDAGTVSARVFADDLDQTPEVGAQVALTRKDVSVTVSGSKDTGTGEAKVQVGVSVPLK